MTTGTGATITRKPTHCPACLNPMQIQYLLAGDLVVPLRLACTTPSCRNNSTRSTP